MVRQEYRVVKKLANVLVDPNGDAANVLIDPNGDAAKNTKVLVLENTESLNLIRVDDGSAGNPLNQTSDVDHGVKVLSLIIVLMRQLKP